MMKEEKDMEKDNLDKSLEKATDAILSAFTAIAERGAEAISDAAEAFAKAVKGKD